MIHDKEPPVVSNLYLIFINLIIYKRRQSKRPLYPVLESTSPCPLRTPLFFFSSVFHLLVTVIG